MVGAKNHFADLRASPACATTRTPWSSTNRVLYVKPPCPSVPTSYSKVLADEAIVPDGVRAKPQLGGGRAPSRVVEKLRICYSADGASMSRMESEGGLATCFKDFSPSMSSSLAKGTALLAVA
jgi:hypothetical protein